MLYVNVSEALGDLEKTKGKLKFLIPLTVSE